MSTYSGLNDAQIAVMTQATPAHLIRQRQGRGGSTFSFLPHEEVTRILNQAFGHAWTSDVKQFGIIEGIETWVLLRLTIRTEKGDIWKEQFGQCDFLKNKQGEIVMSAGDCLKGAASDALTKCASLLGIGLDLYGVTAKDRNNGNHGGNTGNNIANGNINTLKKDLRKLIEEKHKGTRRYQSFLKALATAKTQADLNTLRKDIFEAEVPLDAAA